MSHSPTAPARAIHFSEKTKMPNITLIEYIRQLFVAEHAGHSQTQHVGPGGTVYVECSCGVTLEMPSER